ncbi:MAG TPA: single-stranded-DNA-specific exonuclease RecJ [Flavobacteriaceae bacterium]|nr:single-stranded-DNA-specific exonuclease RecJ [Flavobacteriaceae bacterium]
MRWKKPISFPEEKIQYLIDRIGIDRTTALLLLQRGITDFDQAKEFFNPDINSLHDPYLMKDMDKAIKTISEAIQNKERIMVYGDYDVDGTTSVALLFLYLKSLGGEILTYVPDRYTEGYGISNQGIDHAKNEGVSLIIAIDCGIRAVEQVAYANELDINFIICDHHLPGEEIPQARAILNPKQPDCPYPYKELCACGVGFKLIQAMHTKSGGKLHDLIPYLDLVAIATGADIVPITGENRILAAAGLKQLNEQPKRIGIDAILKVSNSSTQKLSLSDLVFKIAPRINAAGRMKHAHHSVELLIEEDLNKAWIIAEEIEDYNKNRRKKDSSITIKALEQIEEKKETEKYTTVVYGESWHRGVLGIVASRLIEVHHRPTIVFGKGDGLLTASARSVKGFNIYDALNECAHLLEKFGGHKYAAGLSLLPENYYTFKKTFEEIVKTTISPDCLEPEIQIDAQITLSELLPENNRITFPKLYRILNRMRPFGPGNNNPVFLTEGVIDNGSRKVGKDEKHLRISVYDTTTEQTFVGIGFNLGHKLDEINKSSFDIIYSLDENHWNGSTTLQLMVKDVR